MRPRKAASFRTRGEALGRKERGTRNLPFGRLPRPAQLLCGNKEKSRKRTWVERKGKWQKLLSLFRRRGRRSSYKKTLARLEVQRQKTEETSPTPCLALGEGHEGQGLHELMPPPCPRRGLGTSWAFRKQGSL